MTDPVVLDTLMLSRIQFAANISFHILFPAINIALCWVLLFFKLRFDRTQDEGWMRAYRFWVRVFALTFALGVVSGITMSFQFGTNWPGYMERVGNIAGPLLGYEVLTAFFMEATFLGVMLFGQKRVSNRVHTLATLLVAVGTSLSAFWILALNSWMHTPTGHEIRDGVVHAVDWSAVVFNPSMPYRLTHMMIASGLTTAFLIAGVSAYRLLKGDPKPGPRYALKTAVTMAVILMPIQILVGDLHGLNTLEHQPAKIAAMEAVWETQEGAPLVLFAWPNQETRTNDYSIEIPRLASLILTHDWNGEIAGLNSFAGNHPPVAPVFWGFRIMVGIGLLMLAVAVWSNWETYRRKQPSTLLLKVLVLMTFSGWLATLAGWYVTEIGRQPYLVYGILTVEEAVTTTAPSSNVALSLAMYLSVYAFLLLAYIRTLFVMARKAVQLDLDQYDTLSEERFGVTAVGGAQ